MRASYGEIKGEKGQAQSQEDGAAGKKNWRQKRQTSQRSGDPDGALAVARRTGIAPGSGAAGVGGAHEGCLVYDLHRSADAAGAFLLHEVWATRDAHTAHTRTDHYLRWNARKDALCADRALSFWKQVL